MLQIEITAEGDCTGLDLNRLKDALEHAFHDRISGSVSLALVDDNTIARLNQEFLGHEGPTDVLSFSLGSDDDPSAQGEVGEIIVSIDTARREAEERKLAVFEETLRYAVHGLLHLLGYEDDSDEEFQKMKAEQERIVARCCDR